MAKKRYQVQLKASVEKAYAKLPDKAKKRIAGRLRSLEDDPRPPGVRNWKRRMVSIVWRLFVRTITGTPETKIPGQSEDFRESGGQ